jgi:hypothetical protein
MLLSGGGGLKGAHCTSSSFGEKKKIRNFEKRSVVVVVAARAEKDSSSSSSSSSPGGFGGWGTRERRGGRRGSDTNYEREKRENTTKNSSIVQNEKREKRKETTTIKNKNNKKSETTVTTSNGYLLLGPARGEHQKFFMTAAEHRTRAAVETCKTFLRGNEKLAAVLFFAQVAYVMVKTTKRMKKAISFVERQWRKAKALYAYAKENVFDKPKITRSAANDPEFRKLLKDYAKLIHDLYDVPIVPEFIETRVYAQALEQGLEGAFETLDDIVLSGDARVLGHPLVVQRRFVGEDSERLKTYGALEGSKEDELEKFVAEVVENTIDEEGNDGKLMRKLEKKMSKKILSIAARTGTLFLESGVQSFSARIFDAEFYFDVREQLKEEERGGKVGDTSLRARREALRRSRAIQIAKTASDERLRKVIDELQIPPIGILFPELERDVGRLVIAMACEAIDSEVSLPNVDYAVKFDLRVKDQKEYEEDERRLNKQKNLSVLSSLSSSSDDADELAQALADDFMARRKAVAPMFITPELERKTYVDIIKGILGGIGLNAPRVFAEFLGMDVTIQVIRKKNDDKKGVAEMSPTMNSENNDSNSTNDAFAFLRERFNITPIVATGDKQMADTTTAAAVSNSDVISRESVEAFIDWLLADAAYNVQAIPDDVERALYANCFELFVDAFIETTQKVEFSILSRTVKIKTRVAKDAPRDYTKIRRFRPDWQVLDTITEEIKIEREALKKITSNVHAFALAFLSQVLEDASAVICGHEIRLALTTPTVLRKSYDFDDVNVSFDGTTRMSVDYDSSKNSGGMRSFASSKSLREPSRKSAQNAFSAMEALNALATELAMEASSALLNESKRGGTTDESSKDGDFSIDSIFSDLQRDVQKQIAQFGFKNAFSNASQLDSDAISHDAVAFSVFKKYCSPPDETFPFPYLTKAQFEIASLEVIKMAGFRKTSKSIAQKMEALATAADEDENGVIQWGEWYFVSDGIISAVEKAKAQSSKSRQ